MLSPICGYVVDSAASSGIVRAEIPLFARKFKMASMRILVGCKRVIDYAVKV